jgi:hypothetical protein
MVRMNFLMQTQIFLAGHVALLSQLSSATHMPRRSISQNSIRCTPQIIDIHEKIQLYAVVIK